MQTEKPFDLTRTLLTVLFGGLLLLGSLWIMRPFLLSITWACMIVVAAWPLFLNLERRLGKRRWAAVTILTLGQFALVFLPLTLAIGTLISNASALATFAKALPNMQVPSPPEWLQTLPGIGPKATEMWLHTMHTSIEELLTSITPYADDFTRWFARKVGGLGLIVIQFVLTIIISAVMFLNGETLAEAFRKFAQRLAGDRGEELLTLAAHAIRGVALGVGVTALIQALLAGLGLAMAGVPAVAILTAVTFMLCIAQLGAVLVLLPACAWLYWNGQTGWGTFMLFWALIVGNIDAILRPVLIKRGADLPLLLILTGVIGGLIGFGLVGIFLGPLVLAISYTMISAWVSEHQISASNPLTKE